MTRQEQFRAEMAAIFAKYKVEMDVEETSGYYPSPSAITFFAYTEYDDQGNIVAEAIDFSVGTRSVDHTDFK
jgi:hypothetical protein